MSQLNSTFTGLGSLPLSNTRDSVVEDAWRLLPPRTTKPENRTVDMGSVSMLRR